MSSRNFWGKRRAPKGPRRGTGFRIREGAPQDRDFFTQRGCGQRIGFGRRPALVVIDMLKAFPEPTHVRGADLDAQIAATKPLIAADRAANVQVVFSTVMYEDEQFQDAGVRALKQQGVVTLILTGNTTSGCVRAIAVNACQTGFRPTVVRVAVGDRSAAAHDQSLFDLDAKYADVVSLEETTACLQAIGADPHADPGTPTRRA